MTLGEMIDAARVQARIDRKKLLDLQLRQLMVQRDEETGEAFVKWSADVLETMAEIKRLEEQP